MLDRGWKKGMWGRLRSLGQRIRSEVRYYRAVLEHPRTPRASKILLAAALGYLASPIDLIPDFIPIVGHLDDMIIIPLLVTAAIRLVPEEVVRECRELSGLGSK